MADDLLRGRVSSFRREQGFGVITLEDGRDVKFDASACTMVPEEGGAVLLRIAPAKWGGGFKALHVEPGVASAFFAPPTAPALDVQIAALQSEHLAGALSEHVMAQIVDETFGGQLGDAALIDVIDAFYRRDPASARHDGYLRVPSTLPVTEAIAQLVAMLPGVALPALDGRKLDDAVALANRALEAAGDPRRIYRLRTSGDRRAYLVIAADRAPQIEKLLPFA